MPHVGRTPGGGAKGPGIAKRGQGGACHAPTKPVENVAADSDPIVISNSSPGVMCPELFEACRAGKVERVRRLLAHEGVSAFATDFYGKTCFHSACLAGQVRVLEVLLEVFPALLRQSTDDGTTALMFACEFGQLRIARFLLEQKVDPQASSKDGSTALMKASERGSSECVEFLLGEQELDVNARNTEGFTALLYAAKQGRTAVVKALLEAGADPSAKLAVGTSARELAQADGHGATVKALEIHTRLQLRKASRVGNAVSAAPAVSADDGRSLDNILAELEGGGPAAAAGKKKKKGKAKATLGESASAKEDSVAATTPVAVAAEATLGESASAEEDSAAAIAPVAAEATASARLPGDVAPACGAVAEEPQSQPGLEACREGGSSSAALRFTCRVLDEASAAEVDVAMRAAVQPVWAEAAGVIGVERAVCAEGWDYALTVKFAHRRALDAFLATDVMRREVDPRVQQLSHLCVGGLSGVRWQTCEVETLL